jgi:hypothetical protein
MSNVYIVVDAANEYELMPGSPFPDKQAAEAAAEKRVAHDGRVGESRHDYRVVAV